MRERRHKKRKRSERPYEIDLIVPGLGSATDRGSDRFRCSAETRDLGVFRERRKMFYELGQRLLFDVLAARLDGRCTTEEVAIAFKNGQEALHELATAARRVPLSALRDRWIASCAPGSRKEYARQISSFIQFCGGETKAHVGDLNTLRIENWLGSLTDARRGRAGARVRSNSPEAIADRRRRERKNADRAPREISEATRNRYRTAVSGFATYLVKLRVLKVHPTRGGLVKAKGEAQGRMPQMSVAEWTSYCEAMKADLLAPPASVLVARMLRHCGADVGEVLGLVRKDGSQLKGLLVRDLDLDRDLPRIRFKRQKVAKSPERFAPYPQRFTPELQQHVKNCGLRPDDEVFGMVPRKLFEAAHRRACRAIGQPHLRLKDFRHLAAISWAQAGTRLERIQEWLGHSNIRQTVIYSRFAPNDDFDAPLAELAANIASGSVSAQLRAS